jgi:hypothetical protein
MKLKKFSKKRKKKNSNLHKKDWYDDPLWTHHPALKNYQYFTYPIMLLLD